MLVVVVDLLGDFVVVVVVVVRVYCVPGMGAAKAYRYLLHLDVCIYNSNNKRDRCIEPVREEPNRPL